LRKLRRVIAVLVSAISLSTLLVVMAVPAHATTLGDACNSYSLGNDTFKYCFTVEERFNATLARYEVRYREHDYCTGTLCNFGSHDAQLWFCDNGEPTSCDPTNNYGHADFGAVLNRTDKVWTGSWHAYTHPTLLSNSDDTEARFLDTGLLIKFTVACSKWANFGNGLTASQACP
jgi:hypothetical protein